MLLNRLSSLSVRSAYDKSAFESGNELPIDSLRYRVYVVNTQIVIILKERSKLTATTQSTQPEYFTIGVSEP